MPGILGARRSPHFVRVGIVRTLAVRAKINERTNDISFHFLHNILKLDPVLQFILGVNKTHTLHFGVDHPNILEAMLDGLLSVSDPSPVVCRRARATVIAAATRTIAERHGGVTQVGPTGARAACGRQRRAQGGGFGSGAAKAAAVLKKRLAETQQQHKKDELQGREEIFVTASNVPPPASGGESAAST
jgi:hypothetical protein